MSHCAPTRKQLQGTISCFHDAELVAFAKAWNSVNPHDQIKNMSTLGKMQLWKKMQEKLANVCNASEACWLEQKPIMSALKAQFPHLYESMLYFALKPKGTKHKKGWLSSSEIEFVMMQYEQVYPKFTFIGVFPSDWFEKFPREIPQRSLFTKFASAGMVLNLDKSNQPGSHWVAVYMERRNGIIEVDYFDSTGKPPIPRIKRFLRELPFEKVIRVNAKCHQRGNRECGMYSMYFILQRIKGRTMEQLNEQRIPDRDMDLYRSQLFRPIDD